MTQPPHFEGRNLDFSQFHPLDHWPGTQRCWSMYGGPRNHLHLAWSYRWSSWLASVTLCLVGRHRLVNAWRRDTPDDDAWVAYRVCRNCGHRPPVID